MPVKDADRDQVLARLKRAQGQLRAVIAMVESEDECDRIAQQLAATRKALDRAFYDLVACATLREFAALGIASPRTAAPLAEMASLLTRYG